MKVKVCGMTQLEQVYEAERDQADLVGFIFYPATKRYVLNRLSIFDIKELNVDIRRVGVFVNEEEDELLRIADECDLDMIQLHGDETPTYCDRISNHYPVIKAFRMLKGDSILWKVNKYVNVCDYFLFDTKTPLFGGSGEKFDWTILNNIYMPKPYFLSGGLAPEDAHLLKEYAEKLKDKNLIGVDINSRFEVEPGIKNMHKVKKFIEEFKN